MEVLAHYSVSVQNTEIHSYLPEMGTVKTGAGQHIHAYIHLIENSLAIHSQHCKKVPILCLRWHSSSRNLLKDTHLFPSQRTKSDKLLPNLGSFE